MAVISERFDDLGADGAPAKLGIMGGTFDPIHNGHLQMADEVRTEIGLDAVLFIPNWAPVFKRDQAITDGHLRLEMCRRAVSCNSAFDVSAIEIEREGDTYTIDTIRQLRAHYPENVELYLIAGSDSAASMGQWKSHKELAQLVHVAVAERPGNPFDDARRQAVLSAAPFDLHVVEVTKLAISSSDVRARFAEDRPVRYLVPPAVWKFVREHGLYGVAPVAPIAADAQEAAAAQEAATAKDAAAIQDAAASQDAADPLSDEFFEARRAELRERVGKKRFKHIMGVVETCESLARRYGVDERKARLAGLLHDWDKDLDDEGARARVRELGMEDTVDPFVVEYMPRVLHSFTAAVALGRDFPQIPADVLQAIDRHTVGATDMEPLDMVLYIADALEPNRQFGRIDELREAAKKASLEDLYFKTYEYWVLLLLERGKTLHPDTIRIWNSNILRKQAEREA